ncbi:MAG: prepilin peptidase [Phascolarctobacterium sp.]|jgi:type II secretory pathway, prepilin signal peptidase pulO and related peptidases
MQELVFDVFFVTALVRHVYTDLQEFLLYDSINISLAVMGLLHAWYEHNFWAAGAGFSCLLFIMLLLYFVSRGGMGEGDIKLAGVLGIWLGWQQGMLCLLLAFISGGILGIYYLACKRADKKTALPFGPFLAGGGIIAYFWGAQIIAWYLDKFF